MERDCGTLPEAGHPQPLDLAHVLLCVLPQRPQRLGGTAVLWRSAVLQRLVVRLLFVPIWHRLCIVVAGVFGWKHFLLFALSDPLWILFSGRKFVLYCEVDRYEVFPMEISSWMGFLILKEHPNLGLEEIWLGNFFYYYKLASVFFTCFLVLFTCFRRTWV